MTNLKVVKNVYSAISVIVFMFGLYLLFANQSNLTFLLKISGVLLIIFGIIKMMGYFTNDLLQLAFQFDFALGIGCLFIGICFLFYKQNTIEIVATEIGIFMLIDSLLKIQTAMDSKRIGVDNWWMTLVLSIFVAGIGVFLCVRPFEGAKSIYTLMGIGLLFEGVLNFSIVQSTISLKSTRRNK